MRKTDPAVVWMANKVLLLASKDYRGLLTSVVIAGTVVHENEDLAKLVAAKLPVDRSLPL